MAPSKVQQKIGFGSGQGNESEEERLFWRNMSMVQTERATPKQRCLLAGDFITLL
jgi:hypothetical protein